jgi:hypothetical protein
MKSHARKLLLLGLLTTVGAVSAVLSSSAAAAPTSCTVGFSATQFTSSGWGNVGQSFTACASGRLMSIAIQYTGTAQFGKTLRVFAGNTVAGAPLYTQTGVSLSGAGFTTVTLTGNLSVALGHQYTFSIDRGSGIGYGFGPAGQSSWFFDGLPADEFPDLSIGHFVHIQKLWKV